MQLTPTLLERNAYPKTHPGLVEDLGAPVVPYVILLPGLLELAPQYLYPVVVTGSHVTAGSKRGAKEVS